MVLYKLTTTSEKYMQYGKSLLGQIYLKPLTQTSQYFNKDQ